MTFLQPQELTSEAAVPAKNSYDDQTPAALKALMMTKWKPSNRPLPRPLAHAEAHRRRREALSKQFEGETLVIPTGHELIRSNDTVHRFRPGSDFFWLTGNTEPDCVLVMAPRQGKGHDALLFVEPNPGRSSETFFTDRRKGELWVGPRLGVPESQARFAVEKALPLGELDATLGKLPKVRVRRGLSPGLDARRPPESPADDALSTALAELRLIKDALELAELRKAVASTFRGFEDVIRALKAGPLPGVKGGLSERDAEGAFARRARVEGADVGYSTIAACGPHACTLHWTHNDGRLKPGELLLLDAGVEGNSLYTADITRTLPVNGKFSAPQREVYELVFKAQAAAFKAVKPGNDFMEPNRRAQRVLAEGLKDMGILEGSVDEAVDEKRQLQKRWTLHNVSHMLGLDVHDCAKAREQSYKLGKLKAGVVLTVEPGLYFQPDDLTVPERWRGIGVRIEDDVAVTPTGMKNLSAAIPREADAVERWMSKIWRGKLR